MKTWVMVRHAKSSWEFNVSDRERPLATRGIHDAALVAKELNTYNFHFDKVFSSPAKRAFDTSLIMLDNMGISTEDVIVEEQLYDFAGSQIVKFVRGLSKSFDTILTFGHNDACTHLAKTLGGYTESNIPTASAVIFQFDVSLWSDIQQCNCTSIRPKTLR